MCWNSNWRPGRAASAFNYRYIVPASLPELEVVSAGVSVNGEEIMTGRSTWLLVIVPLNKISLLMRMYPDTLTILLCVNVIPK